MEGHLLVYLGLFAAALAAATILPFQSEPALVGLLLAKAYNPWLLVLAASIGNILGSIVIGGCAGSSRISRAAAGVRSGATG